jgi:hypothetical protein
MNSKLTKKKLGDPEGDAAAAAAATASVHSKSGSTVTTANNVNTQQIEKKLSKLEKTVKAIQNKVTDLTATMPLPNFGGTGPAKLAE